MCIECSVVNVISLNKISDFVLPLFLHQKYFHSTKGDFLLLTFSRCSLRWLKNSPSLSVVEGSAQLPACVGGSLSFLVGHCGPLLVLSPLRCSLDLFVLASQATESVCTWCVCVCTNMYIVSTLIIKITCTYNRILVLRSHKKLPSGWNQKVDADNEHRQISHTSSTGLTSNVNNLLYPHTTWFNHFLDTGNRRTTNPDTWWNIT